MGIGWPVPQFHSYGTTEEAVRLKWDIRVDTNGQQSYSSVDDLPNFEQNMSPYAYCLPRYARLTGPTSILQIQFHAVRTAILVQF